MPKSVFISYVYEDSSSRDDVQKWARKGLLGPDIVTITEGADVRQQGDRAIENLLKPRIRGTAVVVGLVGQDSHNHDWVRYELDVAVSFHKTIVLLRIPGTHGAAPVGHQHREIHTFDPSSLRPLL